MEYKGTILYFGGFEMPDKNAAAHRVLNNGKILAEYGYRICFCGIDKTISNMEPQPTVNENDNRFMCWPKPYPKTGSQWAKDLLSFSSYKKCFEFFDDVKYVIAFDSHALPLKKLEKYCRTHDISLVADVSEWYENKFSLTPIKLIKCIDTALVMKHLLKKVDKMIAISEYLRAYYHPYVKDIAVIPPLVDVDEPIWNQPVKKEERQFAKFVYAGTTDRSKDKLDLIIDSFSRLETNDYEIDIFGLTKEEFSKLYLDKLDALQAIGDKIHFKGFVSHSESIKGLLESDCSLIVRDSTRKNNAGFPTKFVEAVTCGTQIIVSDISDVKGFVGRQNNQIHVLRENSVESLSSAVCSVINNSGSKDNVICPMFDFRSWSQRLIDLFGGGVNCENITS